MNPSQPSIPTPEEKLANLQNEIILLQKRLVGLEKNLSRAKLKLRIYYLIGRGFVKLFILLIFGRRFDRALYAIKSDLARILISLQGRDYHSAFKNMKRIEPQKVYGLFEAFVVWRYRPRLLFMFAGGLFTFITTSLLLQQNLIISRQNQLVEKQHEIAREQTDLMKEQTKLAQTQSEATQLQAVSFLISSLDPDNADKNEIAVAQLAEYGNFGFDALIRLVERDTKVSSPALEALLGQHERHNPEQAVKTLTVLANFAMPDLRGSDDFLESRNPTAYLEVEKLASMVPISEIYFVELRQRCEKDNDFRLKLYESMKKDHEFTLGLAYQHVMFIKQQYKLTDGNLHDTTFVQWHTNVYNFCKIVSGGSPNTNWLIDKIEWNTIQQGINTHDISGSTEDDKVYWLSSRIKTLWLSLGKEN